LVKYLIMTFIAVGKRIKAHGLSGEMRMDINKEYLRVLVDKGFLFVQKSDGNYIPFFIESVRGKDMPIIIKLEGVDSVESAKLLGQGDIFLREDDLPENILKIPASGTLQKEVRFAGYTLITHENNKEYPVIGIRSYPMQEMLIVMNGNSEQLIPFVEIWIKSIDDDNQTITMDLPEGLIE
jgi:16S rRNA processing protein RimM